MKTSKFIVNTLIGKDKLYMSLITNTILKIEKQNIELVDTMLEYSDLNLNDEYYTELCQNGFIIEDDYDEISYVKRMHWSKIFKRDTLNLTIIPTLNCDFECIYCYQRKVQYEYHILKDKDIDSIINFIKRRNIRYLNISWYGGEPLLNMGFITSFMSQLNKLVIDQGLTVNQEISTNMYLLDENYLVALMKMGIDTVETTIAGSRELHNILRPNKYQDVDSYNKIINNIEMACKYVKVMLNINLCNLNKYEIKSLIDELKNIENKENLYITFNNIQSYDHNPCEDIVLANDDYQQLIIEISNYILDIGMNVCDMSAFGSDGVYCGGYCNDTFIIGPGLFVYKCESILNNNHSIGCIDTNGDLLLNQNKISCVINDPYQDSFCKGCNILPYCNGGCNNSKFNGTDFCPSEKNYIQDYLKLHYRKFYEDLKGGEEI